MGSSLLLIVTLFSQLLSGSVANRPTRHSSSSIGRAYQEFRARHRSGEHEGDTADYQARQTLFAARKAQVAAHNARGESWTIGLNHFSDYHDHELQMRLGYKRVGSTRWSSAPAGASSLLQENYDHKDKIDVTSLAKVVDWRPKMNSSLFVHNQGGCGSCWAHAAVAALEAHHELISGKGLKLSTQEVIDCTANPRKCGGAGGCKGATAEMAYEYATQFGIAEEGAHTSNGFGKCGGADGFGSGGTPAVRVKSFVRLPENKASFLVHALATKGPVALSIDAGQLFSYHGGVFSGCKKDTVVNHAVLGLGYGKDSKSGKDYWLIKNSWGDSWGESGHFRNERHNGDDDYCGTDYKPEDGVYCEDHPDSVRVCGMCGITSDSTYPVMFPRTSLRQPMAAPVGRLAIVTLK